MRRPGALAGGGAAGLAVSWNLTNTGAVASTMGDHYAVGLGLVGLLASIAFLGEAVVMLPGGRAIDRHGPRAVAVAALVLALAGNALLLVLPGIWLALVLRFIVGIGVGAGFVAGSVYVQADPRVSGTFAQGLYGGLSLSAAGLALGIVPALTGALGWRAPYVSALVVAAVALVVVAPAPRVAGGGGGGEGLLPWRVVADRTILRLAALHTVSFGFSVILGNWVVTLLERTGGFATGTAGGVGALTMILGVVGRPLGGWLSRHRPRATGTVVGAAVLVGALGTALLAVGVDPAVDVLAAALVGLAAGLPFGPVIAGAAQAYPRAPGLGVAATNLYAVAVVIAGAPLLGLTFDLPGDGRIGFAAVAALWAAAILLVPGYRRDAARGA